MSNNLLFGSYSRTKTPLHTIDARVKIVCLLAVTVAAFACKEWWVLVLMALAVLGLARLASISPRQLAGAAKPTAFILLLALIFNMFAANSTVDIPLIGAFGISTAGLARGLIAVGRILILIAFALVLTTTTSSTEVADALTSILAPLEALGVPSADIAMTVSVALRFIPLVAEELLRVKDAQRIRGVKFDEGTAPERVRKWLSVLTPVVVALFRNADDLAKAMRERCYTGKGRTRFSKKLSTIDIVVLVAFVALCVLACLV